MAVIRSRLISDWQGQFKSPTLQRDQIHISNALCSAIATYHMSRDMRFPKM